ncbi:MULTISPECIES: CPBP family intramembrane glutamic endopeptidase [unclassified Gemella]|uniref:CPBP family intramembrane glutamic endopeptidase n=1 Tax=unclassified Gemella TaxID=2624949 RepID=UPI0015CFE025|nr:MULTISPECIES: CPBP family intramembrane glutamic endopeptidase [unclassified Gemella]MBF0710253.1 CPBP family intramembrane metalloprotease [Gemella sp. GL1.1]NYS27597.1 CPBP family intramembrane metalloprotease [Gemella sp. GL1]
MKFNFKNGNLILLLSIVCTYVLSLFLMPKITLHFLNITEAGQRYYVLLFWQVIAIVIMTIIIQKNGLNSLENTNQRYGFLKSVGKGMSFFFIMMLLQMILSIILQILAHIFSFNPVSQNTQEISLAIKSQPIIILYVVVFAPILEELVFRKAIFAYLYDIINTSREKLRFILAAFLSGLIFAIPHDGISPIAIVYIVMAMIFAYLYKKTSNIIAPITAHILMNLAVVIVQINLA